MYNSRCLNEAAFDVGRISSDADVEPNNHLGFSCHSRKLVFTGSRSYLVSFHIIH